ncbi:TRAP transporter substrate-binding protein [Aquabacterium sp. OR-4]|uniref:TRAP transporter substrate-binding protein n=1 Tax=Aquabacterium sp. OR-4 TaxID=2978127 RepID=UPI0021B17511|nr:TRAP transporter substrate-binding protein [Aquabacterium sp. OR-4]MDT7838384.1 TRAP transporter substrate-binding protein [Aquabacterium sp. OR-4]
MKRLMLKTLLALAAVATLGTAAAQEVKERSFKFALQNPKGHPLELGANKFAELMVAKSGGKFKVNVFAGGALGGDAQNVSALQGGTIEFVQLNSGILASQVKDFEVYDFPFMFASAREADAVVDGPFGQKLHAKLADKGIIGLAYVELGFRNLTNSKKPITTVEDIAGLKLRVIPNAINIDWVKALGANPTPLAFPEVYAGLEQKAIDGQENPLSVILANKFFEVQKHLAVTNHQYNPQSIIFSKKIWDALSEPERKIVRDAAVEAAAYQRKVNRDKSADDLQELKKAGMQVTELSPTEQAKLRAKLQPVIDKHGAAVAATVAELQAELAKLRK